jgi:transcriptional regulator with XRE-family HTH domain
VSTESKFADNFKRFRKMKGISQKEFAQRLFEHTGKSLTLTSVSNYETGLHMPPPQILPFIANLLDVSIDALFGTVKEEREEVAEERTESEGEVKQWKQELEAVENDFYRIKATTSPNKEAKPAFECCEKLLRLSKKQQDELLILQTELATIRSLFTHFQEKRS